MITAADLQPFCSTDKTRVRIVSPFSIGDWTYATDGRMLVRVPRLADVPEYDGPAWTIQPPQYLTDNPPGDVWLPIPELPPATPDVPCQKCGGKAPETCPACDGDGEVEYEFDYGGTTYTIEHECPVCEDPTCRSCDGTGIEPRKIVTVEVGGALFNVEFLRKFAALPDAELAPREHWLPCRVRFAGGEGLIMPMRKD